MNYTGNLIFTISNKNLSIEDILENIYLKPTRVIKRGDYIALNKAAPFDVWSYEIKLTEDEDVNACLLRMINQLMPYSEYIKRIKHLYDQVALNLYIRSDMGQIGFEISSEIISKIAEIGIGVNLHVLSFGLVNDDLLRETRE